MKRTLALFAVVLLMMAVVLPLGASAATSPRLPGSVKIVQHSTPHDGQNYAFKGDLGHFKLDDNGGAGLLPNHKLFRVAGGSILTVTQVRSEKHGPLRSLTCSDAESVVNLSQHKAAMHVAPGENLVCTWKNTAA